MLKSKIAISSDDYYSCELTKKIPVRVTILAINGAVGLGFYESLEGGKKSLEDYVFHMEHSNQIVEIKITHKSQKRYWTRVEHKLDYPSIHDTVLESGSMTILPIIIERGMQYHTILSPNSESFRNLLSKLKKRFKTINIRALSSKPTETIQDILTNKQFKALILAYKEGYYKIPRECTLEGISSEIGIKRVALQERIRRAELRIINYFMKGQIINDY